MPELNAIEMLGASIGFIEIFIPLSLPIVSGFDPFTLILYEVPCTDATGIIAAIIPEVVPVKEPITVGVLKLPVAFDSSAVKTFPELKVPVTVKGMLTLAPAQNGLPVIVPVDILVVVALVYS